MGVILPLPTATPTPLSARLRRLWHALVRAHVLEVEPDWSHWVRNPGTIVATRAVGDHLEAS